MPHFRATNLTTDEVTEYDADLPMAAHLVAGWVVSQMLEPEPVVEEPSPPPTVYGSRRVLTHLEFLRLFTLEERIGMRRASKLSDVIEDYLDLMRLAQEINLDDPATAAGVQMMEAGGLLADGRAAEVLRG